MADLATAPVVYTPHPVTLEGQRHEVLHVGETVQQFIDRVIDKADREMIQVRLNGTLVPSNYWPRVKPKAKAMLEVRGIVRKQALYFVAMIALTYFTMGAGAGWIAGTFGVAAGGTAAAMIGAGLFMAGPARGGAVIR